MAGGVTFLTSTHYHKISAQTVSRGKSLTNGPAGSGRLESAKVCSSANQRRLNKGGKVQKKKEKGNLLKKKFF